MNATLRVVDHNIAGRPRSEDLAILSAPLSSTLTLELDGARRYLELSAEEILLATLGRAIARTIGAGMVAVDLAGSRRPVPLTCVTAQQASATEMLCTVHRTLAAVPRPSAGHAPVHVGVRFDLDTPVYGTPPGLRHAIELRVSRAAGLLNLDWWYDVRQFDHSTVEELAEQFPFALIELTSEAVPPIDEDAEMAMAT